jgi:hypothetical protein
LGGATIVGTVFTYYVYVENIFQKNFWRRTTAPEKLKFTWKLNNIVQNQVCKNHDPRVLGEVIIGEAVLHMFIYEKKKF